MYSTNNATILWLALLLHAQRHTTLTYVCHERRACVPPCSMCVCVHVASAVTLLLLPLLLSCCRYPFSVVVVAAAGIVVCLMVLPPPSLLQLLQAPRMFCFHLTHSPHLTRFPNLPIYPRLCSVGYPGYYTSKNFCKFCRTFIPVPGTYGSSVRPSYPYLEFLGVLYARGQNTRGTGTACFVPARNFCELCTPIPQYPELLEVL